MMDRIQMTEYDGGNPAASTNSERHTIDEESILKFNDYLIDQLGAVQ